MASDEPWPEDIGAPFASATSPTVIRMRDDRPVGNQVLPGRRREALSIEFRRLGSTAQQAARAGHGAPGAEDSVADDAAGDGGAGDRIGELAAAGLGHGRRAESQIDAGEPGHVPLQRLVVDADDEDRLVVTAQQRARDPGVEIDRP